MSGNKKSTKLGRNTSNSKKRSAANHRKTLHSPKNSKTKKSISFSGGKSKVKLFVGIVVLVAIILVVAIVNHKSYEEYDLKGLSIKDACEKARGVGWEVSSVHHIESYSDTTDCYNEKLTVSGYEYWKSGKSVEIFFGKEGEKQAECEASGKWYRDGQCKSQEEWENDYAWKNAHAACKKYGSSGYAKTLTDCYIGGEYKGPVNGETTDNSTSSSAPQSSTSNNNTSWRQVLADYESWMNKYIDFMVKYKNTSDYSARVSMVSDYSALVSEMTEWTEKLDNVRGELSTSDLTEYLQTLTRINQRLSEVQ